MLLSSCFLRSFGRLRYLQDAQRYSLQHFYRDYIPIQTSLYPNKRFLNGCVDIFIYLMYNECALRALKL